MNATFPPLAEVLAYTTNVSGYFDPDEIEALYKYACEVPADGVIVEIGVYCGRSSSVLLQAAQASGALVELIDPWVWMGDDAKALFYKTVLRDFARTTRFNVHEMSSQDAAERLSISAIGLLHIDGDHQEDGVRHDCENWLPRLKSGGVACFHDYARKGADGVEEVFPGIRAAVDQYTAGWEDLGVVNTLAMRRKR